MDEIDASPKATEGHRRRTTIRWHHQFETLFFDSFEREGMKLDVKVMSMFFVFGVSLSMPRRNHAGDRMHQVSVTLFAYRTRDRLGSGSIASYNHVCTEARRMPRDRHALVTTVTYLPIAASATKKVGGSVRLVPRHNLCRGRCTSPRLPL